MLLGLPKIILCLLVQPTFGRGIECNRKPNSHFGADTRLAVNNARKRFAAYTKSLCGRGNRYTEWLKAKLFDNFAGVRRIVHQHGMVSVVILVIDNFGMHTIEPECDAPVATDSN